MGINFKTYNQFSDSPTSEKIVLAHIHLDPTLELDLSNLITLCESKKNGVTCHLFVGHCGDYKSFNKNVEEDAKSWYDKISSRPRR